MGKSPAKWIKSVLFGKKASKSNHGKKKEKPGSGKEVRDSVEASETLRDANPSVVSHGADTDERSLKSDSLIGEQNGGMVESGNQSDATEQLFELETLTDPERIRQENAATRAQAAFRGYLARRAFKALKGIIRLQALTRGHLVRRQAVSTLYCMIGIVKLQAIIRGARIRCSSAGLEVQKVRTLVKPQDDKLQSPVRVDVAKSIAISSGNAFVRKIVAPSPKVMSLLVQYDSGDHNSVMSWLERWSLSCPWKPAPRSKKVRKLKFHKKQENLQTAESESIKPMRGVRKVHNNSDSTFSHLANESEKPRRNVKKVPNYQAESLQENPQSELEKIKRSLRKVHGPVTQSSFQADVVNEKPNQNQGRPLNSIAHDVSVPRSISKPEKLKVEADIIVNEDPTVLSEQTKVENSFDSLKLSTEVENTFDSLKLSETVESSIADQAVVITHAPDNNGKDENIPPNEEARSKEDSPLSEHQKSARRASFPSKQDYLEDGMQTTPKVPSYMAATQSAKAKSRGQVSPRFSEEEGDKNNVIRRHSLPSANDKMNSASPKMQKPAQFSGKGGNKNNRSILSSRDGNGKPVQVEWRR